MVHIGQLMWIFSCIAVVLQSVTCEAVPKPLCGVISLHSTLSNINQIHTNKTQYKRSTMVGITLFGFSLRVSHI